MAEYITKSKYPERQVVLDYMSVYGIRIYDAGTFCMIKGDIHVDELQRLTGYKAGKRDGWVLVNMDNGRPPFKGGTLEQTYEALEYLYNLMRSAKTKEDF